MTLLDRSEKELKALVEAGLLGEAMVPAYDLMTRMIVACGLLAPDQQRPPPAAAQALAQSCGHDDIESLLRDFAEARHCVAEEWRRIFGEELETPR